MSASMLAGDTKSADIAASLPPLPERMVGRPFGADEAGRPITHTKGHVIRGAVEYMLECLARRAAKESAGMSGAERETQIAQARAAALDQLVARLNAAIPDPLYHVSAEYLLDDAHSYSTEFDAFACEICRQMSGDPRYHFNRGAKTIPSSLAYLGRPCQYLDEKERDSCDVAYWSGRRHAEEVLPHRRARLHSQPPPVGGDGGIVVPALELARAFVEVGLRLGRALRARGKGEGK